MKWYHNMKIGTKLITGFIIVALIASIVGVVGYLGIANVGNISLPSVQYLGEMESHFQKIAEQKNLLLSPAVSYEQRLAIYAEIDAAGEALIHSRDQFLALPWSAEEESIWSRLEVSWAQWDVNHKKFIAKLKETDAIGVDNPAELQFNIALYQRDYLNWIWLLNDSILKLEPFTGQLDGTKSELAKWLDAYVTRSPELRSMMSNIKAAHTRLYESGAQINRLLSGSAGDRQAQARNIYNTVTVPAMHDVLAVLKEIEALAGSADGMFDSKVDFILNEQQADFYATMALFEELSSVNVRIANERVFSSSLMLFLVALLGVILAVLLGVFISRGIKNPINKLVIVSKKIADGDLDVEINVDSNDEIGILAQAFSRMAESMNDAMSNINAGAEQVASGAQQLSDSSMVLAQGATEQASSIEQLTASLEEISSQTKMNAENANKANSLAENAQGNAIQGNMRMNEMLKAMDEINESSRNISKIIKVIDEIAFQTNILALNAAVEAARAGQHGKGFAVVAEEVRNLAARSANAAKETTDMIEGSIKKVEGGTKIANLTADELNKIVDGIGKVANLVSDIAVASNEQASAIEQVNLGVMQVSDVVQSNSATSEESAAASEELAGMAELMKEQVTQFKLKKVNRTASQYRETENHKRLELSEGKKGYKKTIQIAHKEAAATRTKEISLSDKEYGKY